MDCPEILHRIKKELPQFSPVSSELKYPDEVRLKVRPEDFKEVSLLLHKMLPSPVEALFALDERNKLGKFVINCVFVSFRESQWVILSMDIPGDNPSFESLSRSIYSASLFEREIKEMFGIEPKGNPDLRRLNLHDEVWPQGNYPLRKDFKEIEAQGLGEYRFSRVDGEGIFEVPVGPVHAGIIGPGHFRFSVAGEPIINLETRLGFTHRGVEKLFEGKAYPQAASFAECVTGDSSFAHSLSFTQAAEKISNIAASRQASYIRALFLELERMYNHVNDISGIATDVGFSFPAAFASIIKEALLQLNEKLTRSRYLKSINT
ncbi:MAG: NADH-quinone oxidoreductase subunit C, partial [Candidatus Omnitrophica bacterium]|nr:NADH-quinone oxidoreductase subunit C [Candidatus Omnitrophota bacterium]